MKSIIRKSAPMLIALLPLLTACQSEPEVGDTLYPTEKENYGPKVYINEGSDNTVTLDVVETPVSLVVPEDTYSFYVRLTKPVETDVEIAVAENTEKAEEYGNDTSVMPAGSIALNTKVVKIPAGETQSVEPVELTIPESDGVRNLTGKGVVAISLKEVSGCNSVNIGSNYNTYYVVLNKKVTNFKGQLLGELKEKAQIANANYTITYEDADVTAKLSDGNYTYSSSINGYSGNDEVLIEFAEPQPFVGLSFNPSSYYAYYYCPMLVEILTSNDGKTWTSQTGGECTNTIRTSSYSNDVPFLLYAPITCKYVKFAVYDSFYYHEWYISEMKLYQ